MTEKYVDDPQLQIGMTQYQSNLKIGSKVRTQNGQVVGTVTYVSDNKNGAGEQIYAVVKDPTVPDDQVTEVTVLMRGSSAPSDLLKNPYDVYADWWRNDLPMARSIFAANVKSKLGDGFAGEVVANGVPFLNKISAVNHIPLSQGISGGYSGAQPQLVSSAEGLQEIMNKYPNAYIKAYGHSLGSMDLQFAISQLNIEQVKRISQVWLANGPNIYTQLTSQEKEIVDLLKSRITNYIDPKDIVGMGYMDGSRNAVGMVHFVDSKNVGRVNQHMTLGYQLDANGKIKLLKTLETGPINQVLLGMSDFKKTKAALSSNGFSDSERLYLDSEQARIIADGFSSLAEIAHEQVQQQSSQAREAIADVYSSLREVPWGFWYLSSEEVAAAYADGGVNYATTVGEIEDYIQNKLDKSEKILSSSQSLVKNLKSGISRKEEEDEQAAREFEIWE